MMLLLASPTENYKIYRQEVNKCKERAWVPYLGVLMKDLIATEESGQPIKISVIEEEADEDEDEEAIILDSSQGTEQDEHRTSLTDINEIEEHDFILGSHVEILGHESMSGFISGPAKDGRFPVVVNGASISDQRYFPTHQIRKVQSIEKSSNNFFIEKRTRGRGIDYEPASWHSASSPIYEEEGVFDETLTVPKLKTSLSASSDDDGNSEDNLRRESARHVYFPKCKEMVRLTWETLGSKQHLPEWSLKKESSQKGKVQRKRTRHANHKISIMENILPNYDLLMNIIYKLVNASSEKQLNMRSEEIQPRKYPRRNFVSPIVS